MAVRIQVRVIRKTKHMVLAEMDLSVRHNLIARFISTVLWKLFYLYFGVGNAYAYDKCFFRRTTTYSISGKQRNLTDAKDHPLSVV